MKAILRSLLLALLCAGLTGCFQIERIVSVKADGSGTVTETVIMPTAMLEQMKAMTEGLAKSFGGDAATTTTKEPAKSPADPDEEKLREAAGKMGEGVTFVSAKKAKTAKGEGYTATYAFTDINKLKIDQNPSDAVPSGGPGIEVKSESKPETITFQYTKGKPGQLVVTMPEMKKDEAAAKAEDKPKEDPGAFPGGEEMAMTMMKEMFKDMKISLYLEVDGKLVKTDADFSTGNRVTLMEMDFNKLLANPEKFKALSKKQPDTLEETKELLKGIDGIRFETKPKISVSIQ